MSRLTLTCLVFAVVLGTAHAQAGPCGTEVAPPGSPLYPLPEADRWGFVGTDGEWRIAPQWRQVRPFSEGRAAVETEAGWGLIDRSGAYIVEPGLRDADAIMAGGTAYPLPATKPFSEGCSAVTPDEGAPHYIDRDGVRWDPPGLESMTVTDLGSFSEGLAWVEVIPDGSRAARVGWIDADGRMAIAPDFADGGDFSGGRAPAAMSEDNWGYIDREGMLVFPRKFILSSAASYSEGLAAVSLNGATGYMDDSDWVIESATDEGRSVAIKHADGFHAGRAGILAGKSMPPRPLWIDTSGRVQIDPEAGGRLSLCAPERLARFHDGLLPLVAARGTNICGNPADISLSGPGDVRSGPHAPIWLTPWKNAGLVWLDPAGKIRIDSAACRRPAEKPELPVIDETGELASGAYRMTLSGAVRGDVAPQRADAFCNSSLYAPVGSGATNEGGPWQLRLLGAAEWRGMPVDLSLSIRLPKGLQSGTHEVGARSDNSVSANLWLSRREASNEGDRPDAYVSETGQLTLAQLDRTAGRGRAEMTLVSREDPESRTRITVTFNGIPYSYRPEVVVTEVSGAFADLQETLGDPLEAVLTPVTAERTAEMLVLTLGKWGPTIRLSVPADDLESWAGTETSGSATFADKPVTVKGRLSRSEGMLAGKVTITGVRSEGTAVSGSLTLRLAHVPIEDAS